MAVNAERMNKSEGSALIARSGGRCLLIQHTSTQKRRQAYCAHSNKQASKQNQDGTAQFDLDTSV